MFQVVAPAAKTEIKFFPKISITKYYSHKNLNLIAVMFKFVRLISELKK